MSTATFIENARKAYWRYMIQSGMSPKAFKAACMSFIAEIRDGEPGTPSPLEWVQAASMVTNGHTWS